MKILVTGSKGFIGSNLIPSLKMDGHEVYTFEWGETLPENFYDLDWVIHLGAISSTTEHNIDKILAQNFDFTVALLEKCNVHRVDFQYASSASIYGINFTDFRETDNPDPRSPYAWSKLMIDRYVAARQWNIAVQGFRYFNVYGPGEEKKPQPSPHTAFRRQAAQSKIIKVFDGDARRDFIHVDEVVNIHKKFLNIQKTGVWNVGTGKAVAFLDIAKEIAKETDSKIEIIPVPAILKPSYQYYTCANLTKLNKTLSNI